MAMTPSDDWTSEVAVDAYVYLYPLITMELTRRQMTNTEVVAGSHAPPNQFAHIRSFPSADFREVVRPNFDTLYSTAWLDLSGGPVVVATEAVDDGRYYELPMYDMWTDCFAVPGERTSGSARGAWAVVPPGWNGSLPDEVGRIDAPTSTVWIIGRTQTNGPSDYPAVHRIQDGLTLTPLARWGDAREVAAGVIDTSVDMATPPLQQVNSMSAEGFFDLGLSLLHRYGPHLTDGPLLMQMERAGLVAGARFEGLDPSVQAALAEVPALGLAEMKARLPRLARVVDGWQMNTETMGVYGNSYAKRAIVALVGLGANSPEDAIYPLAMADADGDEIRGERDYVLRFEADELPPVDAFWSLTGYDDEGFQIPNSLDRFALGDRDPLSVGDDGSVELYIGAAAPAGKESNWLPTAPGRLGLTLRLYSPKKAALDGTWTPPPIRKA